MGLANNSKVDIRNYFEKIYNLYYKLVFYVARQYLPEDKAFDVSHDVFVSFFNKIINDNGINVNNAKQYLCTSAKNEAIKILKQSKNILPLNEDIVPVNDEVDNLITLPPLTFLNKEEQYVVTEHVLLDKRFRVIARTLNKPLNTVKSIYRRAITKLNSSYYLYY